ncbi:hypothetical protein [Rhizobium phaseoli]|uniref:Uncharacterized protein n=1 Tax=Rhizobium phaseoli TaxID=396 RepID=A0ABN4QT74_9HYPH|nr:hypothetical protein [Rhizobium phaseoli]ANL87131.1 hypothetical protein AMC81_PA00110 [Rhizobium phaseoli]ANL93640.1 hypothetical protein AMC80_PA00110 [Rhizobium phaseoli]
MTTLSTTGRRHDRMQKSAAYLATKNITPEDQALLDGYMASMGGWREYRALAVLVDAYRRGDLKQMINALDEVDTLTKGEKKVVRTAARDCSRGFLPITEDRMERIEAMIERHGVQIELGTLKIGEPS